MRLLQKQARAGHRTDRISLRFSNPLVELSCQEPGIDTDIHSGRVTSPSVLTASL